MFIYSVNMGILTYLWDIGYWVRVFGAVLKWPFQEVQTLLIFQSQNLQFLEKIYKQTNFNQRKYSFKLFRNT